MMTYLVRCLNSNGDIKDFYRFNYKKAATVKKQFLEIKGKPNSSFIEWAWKSDNIQKIVCYATPDGYTTASEVWTLSIDDIF